MLEAVKKIKMPSMEENGLGVENKEEKMVCGQSGNRFFKKKKSVKSHLNLVLQVRSQANAWLTNIQKEFVKSASSNINHQYVTLRQAKCKAQRKSLNPEETSGTYKKVKQA